MGKFKFVCPHCPTTFDRMERLNGHVDRRHIFEQQCATPGNTLHCMALLGSEKQTLEYDVPTGDETGYPPSVGLGVYLTGPNGESSGVDDLPSMGTPGPIGDGAGNHGEGDVINFFYDNAPPLFTKCSLNQDDDERRDLLNEDKRPKDQPLDANVCDTPPVDQNYLPSNDFASFLPTYEDVSEDSQQAQIRDPVESEVIAARSRATAGVAMDSGSAERVGGPSTVDDATAINDNRGGRAMDDGRTLPPAETSNGPDSAAGRSVHTEYMEILLSDTGRKTYPAGLAMGAWLREQKRPWRSSELLEKARLAFPEYGYRPVARSLEAVIGTCVHYVLGLRYVALMDDKLEEACSKLTRKEGRCLDRLLIPADVAAGFVTSTFSWRNRCSGRKDAERVEGGTTDEFDDRFATDVERVFKVAIQREYAYDPEIVFDEVEREFPSLASPEYRFVVVTTVMAGLRLVARELLLAGRVLLRVENSVDPGLLFDRQAIMMAALEPLSDA